MKLLARAPACVFVALALVTGAAVAEEPAVPAGDVVAVKADRDKLTVLRTEAGHYVVIEAGSTGSEHFYFGDDKHLYRQRSQGGSRNGDKAFSRRFWSPRHEHLGLVEFRDGGWSIKCGKRRTPLHKVADDQAGALLDKGVFHLPLWKREAYSLARDDRGNYYYVDKLRDSQGGRGFRVFVGKKGRMKSQSMVDVVFDSEGAILATKRGKLRLILAKSPDGKNQATWVRGKKRRDLVPVPLWNNLFLIYEELGVYEGQPLGIPCDFYRQ